MEQKMVWVTEHCGYLSYGENDRPNIGIICGDEKTLLVDGGNSRKHAELLLQKMGKKEIEKIMGVAITHEHWDHIYGAAYLGCPVIASPGLRNKIRVMKQRAAEENSVSGSFSGGNIAREMTDGNEYKIPDVDFCICGNLYLELGNLTCVYEKIESVHTTDAYLVYVKEDCVMYIGDILWPYMGGNETEWYYDYNLFVKMKNKLMAYPCDVYIESHAVHLTRAQLIQWMDMMLEWFRCCAQGMSAFEVFQRLSQENKTVLLGYEELIFHAVENCRNCGKKEN